MTRKEIRKEIENLKEKLAWEKFDDLTDYAREQVYFCLEDAIQHLKENAEN